MKRREFLTYAGAASAAPLLPSAGLAGTSTLYAHAAHWTGQWAHASLPMLKSALNLDADGASRIFEELIRAGRISRPDQFGMSKVLVSTYKVPAHLAAGRASQLAPSQTLRKRAAKVAKHLSRDRPAPPQDDTPNPVLKTRS